VVDVFSTRDSRAVASRAVASRALAAGLAGSLLGLLSSGLHPLAATAGARPDARVQEILDGNELFIDQKQARVNQLAYRPEVITTRNSRGSLALSNGAQARISKNSQLRLGADCARLQKGQMLVSGKQDTCVGSIRMSVRGTHYIVEVLEDETTEVAVLDGMMTFSPSLGESGKPSVVPLAANREVLRFAADGQLQGRRCLVSSDYQRYLGGNLLQGFFFPLPKVQALASMLVGSVPGADLLLGLLRTGGSRGLVPLPLLPF
jgi:hypothetical protein